MMQITVRKSTDVYNFVYDDGRLSGDETAIKLVEECADNLEGKMVGPVGGPWTEVNHLSDPLSAIFVIRDAFDDILELKGDIPELPEIPEGAII